MFGINRTRPCEITRLSGEITLLAEIFDTAQHGFDDSVGGAGSVSREFYAHVPVSIFSNSFLLGYHGAEVEEK